MAALTNDYDCQTYGLCCQNQIRTFENRSLKSSTKGLMFFRIATNKVINKMAFHQQFHDACARVWIKEGIERMSFDSFIISKKIGKFSIFSDVIKNSSEINKYYDQRSRRIMPH